MAAILRLRRIPETPKLNAITGPLSRDQTARPSPYVDRGALSEAWYRALYGSRPKAAPAAPPSELARPGEAQKHDLAQGESDARLGRATDAISTGRTGGPARPARSAPMLAERFRTERKTVVTSMPRARRTAFARRLTCELQLANGARLELLVQQRGRYVHVVAVTRHPTIAARLATPAAGALGRAHATLAAHGIASTVDTYVKGSA